MKTTILIADSQKENLNTLRLLLEKEGYSVLEAQNGSDTLELVYLRRIDLALLDISLPGISGHYLVRKIREAANIPILFLSAADNTNDIRTAYRFGADDCIAKPFIASDVTSRVRAHLRKARQFSDAMKSDSYVIRYRDIELDTELCEVRKDHDTIELTPTEYKILRHFMENPERVFIQQQLYEIGWNDTRFVDDTIIGDCIASIRGKLGDTDETYIRYIPELGYAFGTTPEEIV